MLSTMSEKRNETKQDQESIKAVAVTSGKPNTIHLRNVPKPQVDDVPGGRGVLIKILCVGVDGTDKEINAAEYGAAPAGDDYLIIGHESFGQVEAIGPNVREFKAGEYVALSVPRPGSSLYDTICTYDMTTDDYYFERGINLRHGFLTEHVVDEPEYIIRVPENLREVGVLMEPMSVAQKAIEQAYRIQQRLRIWRPKRAAVRRFRILRHKFATLPLPGSRCGRRQQGTRAGSGARRRGTSTCASRAPAHDQRSPG